MMPYRSKKSSTMRMQTILVTQAQFCASLGSKCVRPEILNAMQLRITYSTPEAV